MNRHRRGLEAGNCGAGAGATVAAADRQRRAQNGSSACGDIGTMAQLQAEAWVVAATEHRIQSGDREGLRRPQEDAAISHLGAGHGAHQRGRRPGRAEQGGELSPKQIHEAGGQLSPSVAIAGFKPRVRRPAR